jgi:hypothetical protein
MSGIERLYRPRKKIGGGTMKKLYVIVLALVLVGWAVVRGNAAGALNPTRYSHVLEKI